MGLTEILWTATGIMVPLLLGTAWAMLGLTPPEFLIARGCVCVSALIFIGTAIVWIVVLDWQPGPRIFVAALIGALSLVVFAESFRLINAREQRVLADASPLIDNRAATREKLQALYIECGNLLNAPIPKGISDAEFKKYSDVVDAWLNVAATWIGGNLGDAAKAKFLDRSSAPFLMYDAAANTQHNNILNALTAFRRNLSTLIETNAWDKASVSQSTIPATSP
jgi:hypothetical protein